MGAVMERGRSGGSSGGGAASRTCCRGEAGDLPHRLLRLPAPFARAPRQRNPEPPKAETLPTVHVPWGGSRSAGGSEGPWFPRSHPRADGSVPPHPFSLGRTDSGPGRPRAPGAHRWRPAPSPPPLRAPDPAAVPPLQRPARWPDLQGVRPGGLTPSTAHPSLERDASIHPFPGDVKNFLFGGVRRPISGGGRGPCRASEGPVPGGGRGGRGSGCSGRCPCGG